MGAQRGARIGAVEVNHDFEAKPGLLQLAAAPAGGRPLSVTQLNSMARQFIERNLPLLWVAGEISNYQRAASGHCYFSLKDERAQVRCVLFRTRAQLLDWSPANGMQVEVRAAPSLYEPRGEFQLTVDFMRRAGLGALYERFGRLKDKLEREGLFAPQRKRPLPRHPRRIGIVTSPRAAALRDVLITLRRRMPVIGVIVYPAPVQGDGATQQLVAALRTAAARAECDVLILCRGGGSIEDLWSFNEEALARAIAACSIPVVSGVGHETDFTIADFVADARAPTPTAAAALVTLDRAELLTAVRAFAARLRRCAWHVLDQRTQQADFLARRLVHPGNRIDERLRHLAHLRARLDAAFQRAAQRRALPLARVAHRLRVAGPDCERLLADQRHLQRRLAAAQSVALERREARLERLQSHLQHLDPRQVLERGYSIVTRADGSIVRAAQEVQPGDAVGLEFARGRARARVQDVEPKEE
jgi:exodeoxyribonuclease VII large subunit